MSDRQLKRLVPSETTVVCLDEAGAGGACHEYEVYSVDFYDNIAKYNDVDSNVKTVINFQNGAIKENGVNGCQNEDLLLVVIDRLQGFQKGEFSCKENACALTHIQEALMWLERRTLERQSRGVEGTNVK